MKKWAHTAISAVGMLALVGCLAPTLLAAPAEAAPSQPAIGNDISWPQCGGSYPSGQDFGIVGVNGGMPEDANPCLGSELGWAAGSLGASAQPDVSLYVNTADPGDVDANGSPVSDWPAPSSPVNTPDGTCTATTTVATGNGSTVVGDNTPGCAWYYGAQRGNQDMAWLAGASSSAAGAYPWWLDVETGNTWQGGPSGQAMNMAVLQGLVAALQAGGVGSIGVYSTSLQWGEITGGGAPGDLSGLPVWLPGATDVTSAEANCYASSFTGGPIRLTQWTQTYDEDAACGSVSIGPIPTQIYGVDAIATSIAISTQEFPSAHSAGAVVLARSDFFSDALAGGPLAAAKNAPLLITPGGSTGTLDPRVESEIQRVLAPGGTVYVLGGDLALPASIDTTLTGLGYHVVREAGANEYATAVDIAGAIGNPGTVFLATGLSFYDALSSVPAAILNHAAILLTNGNQQAPETGAYLAQHPGTSVYAIGGPLAAAGADPAATAVYGSDQFGTSAAVASTFFPSPAMYSAATYLDFPDALGGGVFMATGGRAGPLLLVDPDSDTLPAPIEQYVASLPANTPGYVFGGPLAVPSRILDELALAVG